MNYANKFHKETLLRLQLAEFWLVVVVGKRVVQLRHFHSNTPAILLA